MPYYPSRQLTDKQKESVYTKHDGRCVDCGYLGNGGWFKNCEQTKKTRSFLLGGLEIHHIKRVVDGGCKDIENLVLVCQKCHIARHKN